MDIKCTNLSKTFGDFYALKDINLELSNGIYGLLGANGAGKTTFIKILMKIIGKYEGSIEMQKVDIKSINDSFFECIGYLPQYPQFYKNFSAFDFLMYISALKSLGNTTAKKRSLELLESVGLLNVKNKKIGTFSGGMRQRLGICQVLLNDPELIILDEPTTGLDPSERVRFRNLLSTLSKEKTIILSTHIVSDIEFIASHIILLKEGKLIKNHKPENLISDIRGKVYTVSVPFSDINDYIANNKCISTISQNEDGYIVRYISEKETSDAATEPNLEDVFLYYNRI